MKRISFLSFIFFVGIIGYCQDIAVLKEYTPPFKQGDAKWKSFNCARERILALQIPDSLISQISTRRLLELCLDFPYLTDMYAFENHQQGFMCMISEYNGYGELLKRNDIMDELLYEYSKIGLSVPFLSSASNLEKGKYSFKCDLLVKLIKTIEAINGLPESVDERLLTQTEINIGIIQSHPELFGTMCKESLSSFYHAKKMSTYTNDSRYDGEIVYKDGAYYRLSTRNTPASSNVVVGTLTSSDLDSIEVDVLVYNVLHNYNNVNVVGVPTRKYNGHGHAWYQSDGHPFDWVWIGVVSDQDEDVYKQDGSYYSVTPTQATHVVYSNEHTAIRLPNGRYRSKWDILPLVEHDSLEVPAGFGTPVGFYKKFSPSLSGPSFFYSSATYSLGVIPSGYTVNWNLSDSYYYNHNLFITNYPTTGHCLIMSDHNHDMKNATLTAYIKYNGDTIQTLKKEGIYAYDGFWGWYTSGDLSDEIDYTYYFNVKRNVDTRVTSPNLVGATVSYDTNACIPTFWWHNSTDGFLEFRVPNANLYIPVVIYVTDMYGHNYTLYAAPSSLYNLNIILGENGITIMLNGNSESDRDISSDQSWTVEVRSVTTGELNATLSSTSRSETISTEGWPKGIYIVKVTIGKNVFTEKVIVR